MHTVFRWNIARREQLGRLVEGEPAPSYPEFLDDLRQCCARVLAMAGDSRLVFVGRSPESLFDYLSGALARTSWASRLALLNVSMWRAPNERAQPAPSAISAVRAQLAALGLEPARIAASGRPVALIDLVCSGHTFGALVGLILDWAMEDGVDVRAVRRRLRIVGITERKTFGPGTWRWQRGCEWAAQFRPSALKSVSVPPRLWDYLGNAQQKVARTNPPELWGDPELARPPREEKHVEALRLAVSLYAAGASRSERLRLASLVARERAR